MGLTASIASLFIVAAAPPAAPLPPDHPPVSARSDGGGPTTAEEVMKRLDASEELRKRPKTFEVAGAMGRLYYAHGRFPESLGFLKEAIDKAAPVRAIAAAERKKLGAVAYAKGAPAAPSTCGWAPGAVMEAMAQALKAKPTASCARAALTEVSALELLAAQVQFIQKDPASALQTLNKSLELSPDAHEARYARGYIHLDAHGNDLPSLRAAKVDFDGYLAKSPNGPHAAEAKRLSEQVSRAIAAGGIAALERKTRPASVGPGPLSAAQKSDIADPHAPMMGSVPASGGSPPPLTQEMVDAVQNTEHTPELEKGLADLVEQGEGELAKGRYQEALDVYKRVVPFQPNNGRAKAGMAWALVGLNRQPMAERIWGVAVSSDARAVDKLGDALKAKGDAKGATALWIKLAQSSPDYAKSAGLEAKLK